MLQEKVEGERNFGFRRTNGVKFKREKLEGKKNLFKTYFSDIMTYVSAIFKQNVLYLYL